jgi:hypothetical protein
LLFILLIYNHCGISDRKLFLVLLVSDSEYSQSPSQVNTLPKAKSKTRSKQNKDMHKCSSVYRKYVSNAFDLLAVFISFPLVRAAARPPTPPRPPFGGGR